jgi:hypothetical protein
VHWRVADRFFGAIDADGVFSSCYAGGTTQVRGLLQSDTTQVANATVQLVIPAVALISVQALSYEGGRPVRLDSVAGTVRADVRLAARILACREVRSARLELVRDNGVSVLGAIAYPVPPTDDLTQVFTRSTAGRPNGSYSLRAMLSVAPLDEAGSGTIPLRIQNP